MDRSKKQPPLSVVDFEKIVKNDFYYVDKTGLITDLLTNWCDVTLFTRPRRFGKTLNMSMLESFFSINSDKSIFTGLKVANELELCEKYMGRYPVIHISLKSVEGIDYNSAFLDTVDVIKDAAMKVDLQISGKSYIHPIMKRNLEKLLLDDVDEHALSKSLFNLTQILKAYYGRKVILLIDEYDVPLAKAFDAEYYDPMILLFRKMLVNALKDNSNLELAVLTGCLRISKESLFTGLNNIRVSSIADSDFDQYFGFTDDEVLTMLDYYGFREKYGQVKEWYDGYRFGSKNIYCPWDVINYCARLRNDHNKLPESFWVNSSGNVAVRNFIKNGDAGVKQDIESLMNGEAIQKKIRDDLTYQDVYSSSDNMWSLLYATGYLTCKNRTDENLISLTIPNQEVHTIFTDQILEMFNEEVHKDPDVLKKFCDALYNEETEKAQDCMTNWLDRTISVRDPSGPDKDWRESFFHAILLGALSQRKAGWNVHSNWETGDGYCDIVVFYNQNQEAILIEVKYAAGGNFDSACRKAVDQIKQKRYVEGLYKNGCKRVIAYGIAFHCKECKIVIAK